MKARIVFAGFVGVLFLTGCSRERMVSHKVSFETSGSDVCVMTFNIRYGTADDGLNCWQYRKDAMFNQIADLSPDVAGLQEALEFQAQQIRQALPEYGTIGVGRNDGKKEGEQCCILYRKDRFKVADSGTFWFSDTPGMVGSKHWGNTLPRICTWVRLIDNKAGKGFYVYNVHLDNQSAPSRKKSTELLAEKVAAREGKEPFVVTGDFNCGPGSPEMMYLLGKAEWKTSQPMIDVLGMIRPEQSGIGTYHAFVGGTGSSRIDMILTGPDVKTRDAQIDQRMFDNRYASDHFPVVAALQL